MRTQSKQPQINQSQIFNSGSSGGDRTQLRPTAKFCWRFLPISLATLTVITLLQLGICQPLENLAYNALFQLRGAIPWSQQVVVVEMDEASLRQLGHSPWMRQSYTNLINKLAESNPAVIVLDVAFLGTDPEDELLAEAIARQGRVVLAQSWDSQGNPLLTSPALRKSAIAIGHKDNSEDSDGLIRAIAAQINGVPALGIAAAQVYAALQPQRPHLQIPTRNQPLWINWLGSSHLRAQHHLPPHYSFISVLQGKISAQAFHNNIVLVGITVAGVDTLRTPFDRSPPSNDVYLHGTLINNLLQHNFLHHPAEQWLELLLLLGGISLSKSIVRWRFLHQIGIWGGLCLGWGMLSIILFNASWLPVDANYWLPVVTPILWFGLCGGTTALAELLRIHILLHQSEERYALAARGSNEGLWDWDLRTDRLYFSPRWKEMLGYKEHELSDRPQEWFSRVHALDVDLLKQVISNHLQGVRSHFDHEYRLLHQDGGYRWMLCRGLAVRDREGKPERMVGSQTDITQRKKTEEELRQHAFYDQLTGLPNRASFALQLQQAIANAHQHPMTAFAVLWLDIDQFKVVNNSLGNAIGDRLLIAIAQRLKAFLSPEDAIARLGGDEFAILLRQVQDLNDVTRMVERVQQVLSLPFNLDNYEVFPTVSIGIALSSTHYTQPDHLLRDADTAMHRAKALGRARYKIFDKTMRTRMLGRLQLENDLRRAIAKGERYLNESGGQSGGQRTEIADCALPAPALNQANLEGRSDSFLEIPNEHPELQLYYQPIICLNSGLVIGFEALVRWQHPDQGFLPPARFIPMAEETGLIIPLGWWVLRAACYQMRQWQKVFPAQDFLTVSVNLSSQQFSMAGLIEQIRQILRETHLEAAHLKLEMTESTVMQNAASVVDVLQQIRAQGIQLAIDDFGTGYSSLSYLPRFPIDSLKIDRSFVSRIEDCDDNLEIIRTILSLAHNLGMDVTAEGVENSAQASQLLEMHCEYGQGFLFSKPLDANSATKLLAQQQY